MNIGDIWFGLRGEDAGLQVDAQKAGQAAGEGFGNSFGGKMQAAFGTGGMVGVWLAAGAMAFNALGGSGSNSTELAFGSKSELLAREEQLDDRPIRGYADALEATVRKDTPREADRSEIRTLRLKRRPEHLGTLESAPNNADVIEDDEDGWSDNRAVLKRQVSENAVLVLPSEFIDVDHFPGARHLASVGHRGSLCHRWASRGMNTCC